MGSEVGVDGGGVELMGQAHQGVVDETCWKWITFSDSHRCNTSQT